MSKLGSYLIILVLLTAYGRCVADQFGMLHTSKASCCTTVCDAPEHCLETESDHSDGDSDAPAPCQLCFILDSDSMLIEDGLEIPTPNLLELSDFLLFAKPLDDLFRSDTTSFSPDLKLSGYSDPPAEQRSRQMRIDAKTTPVRGPSNA